MSPSRSSSDGGKNITPANKASSSFSASGNLKQKQLPFATSARRLRRTRTKWKRSNAASRHSSPTNRSQLEGKGCEASVENTAGDHLPPSGSASDDGSPMKKFNLEYIAQHPGCLEPPTSQVFGQPSRDKRQASEAPTESDVTAQLADLLNHAVNPSDIESDFSVSPFPPNDQADNILNKKETIEIASDKIRRIVAHVLSRGTHCCEDIAAEFKRREDGWEAQVNTLWREKEELDHELRSVRARYNESQARLTRMIEAAGPLVHELSQQSC